jgi:hypothetical protein
MNPALAVYINPVALADGWLRIRPRCAYPRGVRCIVVILGKE